MNSYAVFLTFADGRKRFNVEAESIYAAIANAVKTHGGKFWLAWETAESQARR